MIRTAAAAAVRRRPLFPDVGRPRIRGIRRRKQPARHFDTGGLRFDRVDARIGAVTLDLFELVAVDDDVAAGRGHALATYQWPDHGAKRPGRHQRQYQPEHH